MTPQISEAQILMPPSPAVLAVATAMAEPKPPSSGTMWVPPVPDSLDQLNVGVAMVEQLIVKILYVRGEMMGRELAAVLGVKFSLIDALIENFKRHHVVQIRGSLGMGNVSSYMSLSEAGRNLARQHMESNQYAGALPVALDDYTRLIHSQRLSRGWLSRERLIEAYRHVVITSEMLAQIGPAVNSGNSLLLYGQPGNGKTFLAEALAGVHDTGVFVPHAIDCNGSIVKVFDPVYHKPLDAANDASSVLAWEPTFDQRYVRCRRPFIVTGGELTMDMLDLSLNATAKFYDAPLQVKANNGIYLIDDFGRQRATPAEILNRWIVPMERRIDYLNLQNGGKVTAPFETFIVFSTNLRPEQLGDEAFLRRIQYKLLIRNPSEGEFMDIFVGACKQKGLQFDPEPVERFLNAHYRGKRPLRRCHPRDLLGHAADLIDFEELPPQLTYELLERAAQSYFAQHTEE